MQPLAQMADGEQLEFLVASPKFRGPGGGQGVGVAGVAFAQSLFFLGSQFQLLTQLLGVEAVILGDPVFVFFLSILRIVLQAPRPSFLPQQAQRHQAFEKIAPQLGLGTFVQGVELGGVRRGTNRFFEVGQGHGFLADAGQHVLFGLARRLAGPGAQGGHQKHQPTQRSFEGLHDFDSPAVVVPSGSIPDPPNKNREPESPL